MVPTPVRRVEVPGLRGRLWVKDEGRASELYGGNKVRKLLKLLEDARAQGATDLVTAGAVGSHHVLATAIHGAGAGFRTHALLFPQPASDHVRHVAAAVARLCASCTPLSGPAALPWARFVLARRLGRETGRAPYWIPLGGSSPVGVTGWIEAGLELAEQVKQGALPPPARIYVALGTGGTAAGLIAGAAVAGLDTEVVAVQVVPWMLANVPRVRFLAWRGLRRTGRSARLGRLRIVRGWFGEGYGKWDARVEAAAARAREAGIEADFTYTGKTLGACFEELERDEVDALYVHTLSAVEPTEDGAVPRELEPLLQPLPSGRS